MKKNSLGAENDTQNKLKEHTQNIVGNSFKWQKTLELLCAAAAAPRTSILLTGEPGVGKEVAAQLIHDLSNRAQNPLISLNIACIPATLLESELFGYEAGAFTNAQKKKRGLFEQADGGTIFLDEIGELPLHLQAKLLRILEGKPFHRLGGEKDIAPDVRLTFATNRPLEKMVQQGLFREDLYHRIHVLEIALPPLRERGEDIEKLAVHFLRQFCAEFQYDNTSFSKEALLYLRNYPWPGNIRELRNVIERSLIFSKGGCVCAQHLPTEVLQCSPYGVSRNSLVDVSSLENEKSKALKTYETIVSTNHSQDSLCKGQNTRKEHFLTLDEMIYQHIRSALVYCKGNITHASMLLGITRQTLRRRLKMHTHLSQRTVLPDDY